MYGYQEEVKSARHFGLNEKVKMTKFEWINNAGKGGTEGEALDIQFTFAGEEKPVSYRQFPVTKARDWKNNVDITDPSHPVMQRAMNDFNANITTLVKCFVPAEVLSSKLGRFESFKEYCKALVSILPSNFDEVELDLFLQWQYNIKDGQNTTFLEIPKNGRNGAFVCRHKEAVGSWELSKYPNGSICYRDGDNNVHPFSRDAKWMETGYSHRQEREAINDLSTESVASPSESMSNAGW